MKLRPNIAAYPPDEELVLFSEELQLVLGLNGSASFIFRELERGSTVTQVAQALVLAELATLSEADEWVTATIAAFHTHGLFESNGKPKREAPAPSDHTHSRAQLAADTPLQFNLAIEQCYRLLNSTVLVRFGHHNQVPVVDSVIGHLRVDRNAEPTVVMDVPAIGGDDDQTRSQIYRDGELIGEAARLGELAPIVKSALWQSAVNAYDFLFYIHAGVVGTAEGCLLMPAAAGSGKSSLTAALVHHGFQYYSDEVALIGRNDFRVPPVPLAICVKSTGWDLITKYYPCLRSVPSHIRGDGKIVRYVAPSADGVPAKDAAVRHIVFPQYRSGTRAELKRIARGDAIGRLMGECLALSRRLDCDNVGQLVRWIAGIDCYTLDFSSLEEATGLITMVATPK